MTNILIADDHQIVIDGILQILKGNKKYKVVATANSGSEALNHLDKGNIDIAILDIEMPPPDGVDLSKILRERYPRVSILILTMHNSGTFISEIMQLGTGKTEDFGIGFVLKNKGKEELIDALDTISQGQNYFGKEVTNTIFEDWIHQKSKPLKKEQQGPLLTNREKEVLKLIAAGKSTPKIAKALFIANSTVETHRRNLISKCEVDNSKELMLYAIKNGFD